MIGALIENYETLTVVGVFAIMMAWYLFFSTKHQAKREDKQDTERTKRQDKRDEEQKEERDYYRGLIKNDLQKNAVLNSRSLNLQKEMTKDHESHNGHTERFSEKILKSLALQTDAITLVCDKLNGGNPDMVEAKKRLNKDRRKKDKKVEVERRV